MSYQAIVVDKRDSVCTITLNRPEADNRINILMAQEFVDACQSIIQDKEVRIAIITGAGDKSFCLGSIEEDANITETSNQAKSSITTSIISLTCPVIAAINGDAFDQGLELALACDIRIASDTAHFSLSQIKDGHLAHDGATQLLPRIVGKAKALELVLTADTISTAEALSILEGLNLTY